MTSTTTNTSAAPAQAQTDNQLVRAYFTNGVRDYPPQIRYNRMVYTKCETVGTPEYFTSTRRNWLAGVRAVQLVQAGQAEVQS